MSSPEVEAELSSLRSLLGELESRSEIIHASEYLDAAVSEAEEKLRKKAFDIYVSPSDDAYLLDINFYRLIGDVPASMITDYDAADGLPRKDLLLLAQRWASLSLHGVLGRLESHEDIIAVNDRNGSPAEVLRAFLECYRRANGFERWNRRHMRDLRLRVVKIWQEQQQRGA